MERLSLIDVSSEDDLLISSSAERHLDPRSSGLSENHGHNYFVLEPADAPEEENLVKMSKQWEQIPEMSESPEQMRANSGKVNLRKSLAWDSAFFTSEGVLDTEELAIVNSTFRKTELCSVPEIQEELQKSTESTSTLDSESYTLENLEGDLFENVRASIQKSLGNRGNCSRGEPDASRLGLRMKVELRPQTKMKPPVALKTNGVNRQQFESTSKGAVGVKEAAKRTGDSKLLLKPPRIVPKPASLPTVPSNKAAKGTGDAQLLLKSPRIVPKPTSLPTVPSNKDSSENIIKNNSRRTSSGKGANRQGTVACSKTNGDSNNSLTLRSISSLKDNPGSHLGTVVFSTATCLSNSSPVSGSSSLSDKPLLGPTRKSVFQNTKQSLSGSTIKTPVRTSKSRLGPSNAIRSPTFVNSTFKFSSRASPSSSIDSVASEASSSTSTSNKPSNSVESFASSTSSSPSIAIPTNIDAHHHKPTDKRIVSTQQPRIRKEISANLLPSRPIAKASVVTRVLSDPSNKDHVRSSINNNTGTKSFKPSGLRMPSPKIGYFDAEKTLVGSSNKISQIGLRNSSLKDNGGPTNAFEGNKPRSSKIPSISPAHHASMNFRSLQAQSTPLSPHSMIPASPLSMHQQSKPAQVHKDLSPLTGESSHGMVDKEAMKVADGVHMQPMATLLSGNGSPFSGERSSKELPFLSMHQQSKPALVHKDLSPLTGESSHDMVDKPAMKVADGVYMQPMATSLSGNGSPFSGEGSSKDLPFLSMHQQSKPAQVHKDYSPLTSECSHSMVDKAAMKVADGVHMQPMATSLSGNGSPFSGEGSSKVTHKEIRATYQFDEEVKHVQLTSGYNQDGRMANELHSVSIKSQKENLIPPCETNCLPQHSPNECQKTFLVDIMDKKMSSLSLSETTDLVGGD